MSVLGGTRTTRRHVIVTVGKNKKTEKNQIRSISKQVCLPSRVITVPPRCCDAAQAVPFGFGEAPRVGCRGRAATNRPDRRVRGVAETETQRIARRGSTAGGASHPKAVRRVHGEVPGNRRHRTRVQRRGQGRRRETIRYGTEVGLGGGNTFGPWGKQAFPSTARAFLNLVGPLPFGIRRRRRACTGPKSYPIADIFPPPLSHYPA